MSLFSAVEMAPRDPILGLNEQFNADTNPNKVNLGVGVYFDDNGKLPLLACVQAAEKALMDKAAARGYLPIDGIAAYDNAVQGLVFGADSDVVKSAACPPAGPGRHRRPQGRRRLPQEASTPRPRC
jgi:aromatic-amino-acid transaminase